MLNIIHKPYRKLIIMEYNYYPKPETLASTLSLGLATGQIVALYWTEGVVFIPVPVPLVTERLADEYMRGRIYWSTVVYSFLPALQPSIKVGGLEIPIIDVSPNATLRAVALWLKERTKQT